MHGFSGNGGFKQVTFITLGEQNATQKRSGTGGRRTLRHRWSVEVIPTSAGGETRYEHLSKSIDQLNTSPPLTDDSSTSIGPTLLRGSLPSHNELPSMRISVSAYQRNTMTTTDTIVSK
ncbi:hypothetical protein PC116_g25644 [Phytophthora cactorum]|nr:hypothetical protein PC112_g17173 [Phytophthora cactorum]KAG4225938.1 hypothetical protein PC116_g25644 [Phytophthora cactorum]